MRSPAMFVTLSRHALLALLEAALIASLMIMAIAVTRPGGTFAARQSNGPTLHASLPATLAADSSPSTFVIDGSGFAPHSLVKLSVANPGCCVGFSVATDDSGDLHVLAAADGAGYYVVKALDSVKGRIKVIAETTLNVP